MNRLVCNNAVEIGYNAGFSSLLMMVSNPDLKISCFDIAYHRYTIPCYKRICEDFPGRVFLTVGDSKQTFTHFVNTSIADGGINKYNLIHVDGCHLEEEVISDIKYSMALAARAKYGSHIIIDDYDSPCIHETWDSYLTNEKYNIEDSKFYLEKNEYQDIKFIRGGDLPDGFN